MLAKTTFTFQRFKEEIGWKAQPLRDKSSKTRASYYI
jgi:hypothetical protein